MFCVKFMLIPGAVPFSDLRSNQKRPNFGAHNRVPKNGPFFRPDTGGRAFWVGKR